jgi:LmbE family N-acetylglucosaminyl deacetylase
LSTPGTALSFSAESVDPAAFFPGRILLTVPHQDDGVLACGATLARLGGGAHIHVVYATDGADSPSPLFPMKDARPRDLARIRMGEAIEAMERLGVPATNVHFLGLADGQLDRHATELRERLSALAGQVRPDHVLAPFRYDRHPDHLALNRAVMELFAKTQASGPKITEYFVYYQSRLLPRGDVRAYIRPGRLRQVSSEGVAALKRETLDCFRSQTTRFYPWQTRPNLSPRLLDDVSLAPEVFLRFDPELSGSRILTGPRPWILLAHRMEPILKKRKDQLVALLRRGLGAARQGKPKSNR